MEYQVVFYTEYHIRYTDNRGNDHSNCKIFKRKVSAQNWIDKRQKPSFIDHYYIQEVKVTYHKLKL